jgi:hypothetical protein
MKAALSSNSKPRSSRGSADFAASMIHINYIKSITQNKPSDIKKDLSTSMLGEILEYFYLI